MNLVHYAELTPGAFAERLAAAPIAYLPLGTLEWHGLHMPYGTDFLVPDVLFTRVAAQVGGIVLPPLFVSTDCHEHGEDGRDYYGMDFCCKEYPRQQLLGSVYWLPDALFRDLLRAIAKQLARAGFRIIVGEGHGPSHNVLLELAEEFKQDFGLDCLVGFDYDLPVEAVIGHAGPGETSLMMAARSELVHMENLPAAGPIVGSSPDPRGVSSAAIGERMYAAYAEDLVRRLNASLAALKDDSTAK